MALGVTFPLKKEYEFAERFAIANFYFDEPFITNVRRDAKISNIGKLVRIPDKSFALP